MNNSVRRLHHVKQKSSLFSKLARASRRLAPPAFTGAGGGGGGSAELGGGGGGPANPGGSGGAGGLPSAGARAGGPGAVAAAVLVKECKAQNGLR